MRHACLQRLVLLVGLLALAVAAPGCALFNSVDQTQITVEMRSDQLLHLAALPRLLPDGSPATEQRDKLLDEVAELAGGYTLIDNVLGGWVPPGQKQVVEERNDLLLVKGPPEAAYLLEARLREDFQQLEPFVESLPIQAIAVVYRTPQPMMGVPTAEEEALAATAE